MTTARPAPAPAPTGAPLRREVPGWGTVLTLDVVPTRGDAAEVARRLDAALPLVEATVEQVDRVFSTWREDSLVCALRTSRLGEEDLGDLGEDGHLLLDVLARCRRARAITRGSFDPWAAPGGLDPSGYVKGWGAGRIADLLVDRGLPDVCVNAAGDLAARGRGPTGGAWRAGIVHPDHRDRLCASVPVGHTADIDGPDGSVATSGFSEQVGHVLDPRTHRDHTRARQASVVGPDAGLADALATALLIDGTDGAGWFEEFAATDLRWGRLHSRWGALLVQDDSLWRLGTTA